jgi:hypothetical protein
MNSCLRVIQLDTEPLQMQQNFICSLPRFFFLSLDRHVWINNFMVKDCNRVTFPIMFDMVPYAFLTKIGTLVNWLPAFLTRQSRERLKSSHDIPHNIPPTDSIE